MDYIRCDIDKNGAVNAVDAAYVLSFYATSKTKISFTDYMKNDLSAWLVSLLIVNKDVPALL